MHRHFGVATVLILMLLQLSLVPAFGLNSGSATAGIHRDAPKEAANPAPGRERMDTPGASRVQPFPARPLPPCPVIVDGHRSFSEVKLPGDASLAGPVRHRGELTFDRSIPTRNPCRSSSGPDTPPPSNGDWTVDETGNNVNNTTIILNGNLMVTTGDLTLDNVTLIMNCTIDGQYGINVSSRGVLNLTNCNITAFSGSLHYKFAVFGEMTMDRCDVSEMWGDSNLLREGGGVALFSDGAMIRSSTISKGETNGIQVHGSAAPKILNTEAIQNVHNGLLTIGQARPTIMNCSYLNNTYSGIYVFETSTPKFTDCTFGYNRLGIMIDRGSAPVFTSCTSRYNEAGIETYGNSAPLFINCTVLGSNTTGIATFEYSTPVFSNCTSSGDNYRGVQTTDNSAPLFRNCTFSDSNFSGIGTFVCSAPVFTDCIIVGAKGIGIGTAQSSNPVFINCTVSMSDKDGIATLDDSHPTFMNCTSSCSTNIGIISRDRSHPTFTNCISSNSNGTGIGTSDHSTPVFTNCTVLDSNDCGIDTEDDSTPVFIDCTSSGSTYHGVQTVYNSTPVFTNCISKGNKCHGILVAGSSTPKLTRCSAIGNNMGGITLGGSSKPVLADCTSSDNGRVGLAILENSGPRLEGIHLSGNGGQNLWVTSSAPVILANSTLAGGSSLDIQLGNSSRLTLLNTTYTIDPLVEPNARLKVQWYLTFRILDRASRPIVGAVVDGTGKNESRVPAITSGPEGIVRDMIATEYVKNGSAAEQEHTYYSPYDFSVAKDGETNTTRDIPADRTLSWKLYIDFAPRFHSLPDTLVTEDQPTRIDLAPHLLDQDDPISRLGLSTDRDYVVPDNATLSLVVNCPYHIESDVVTVTVSDGLRNSSQVLTLQIIPVNDRPGCRKPIPDMEAVEDETLTIELTEYMWDEESGGRLTFTCNREEIAIDNVLRQASWTPGEGNSSLAAVIFTARDGYLEGTSNAFNITFIPVNDPPIYLCGLSDATVEERQNWTLDLRSCFWDEEDTGGLKFESSNPAVVVDNARHAAYWSPSGDAGFSIEVLFIAHDASNYSMTAESDNITLTYVPVNDPPVYSGTLKGARLKPGEEWNITLEDYFRDDDTETLRFSSNNPNVKIVELNKTKHCAVWKPDKYSSDIAGLVITAYDGRTYARTDPITLDLEPPVIIDQPEPVTNIIQRIPWYVYVLMPLFLIAGVAAFYAYRKVKYGRYDIEQIFLVYGDGRLLAHRSTKKIADGGEQVISGMLTALQGFIKESLQDAKRGELDEMKYGDLTIAIERGEKVYLAVFLSGYVTEKLRAMMVDTLQKVNDRFGGALESWDGTVSKLKGIEGNLDGLMGGTVTPAEAATPSPGAAPSKAAAPAPAPASTKKLLQRVIAFMPAAGPGEEVVLKGELEFYQGFVRLKVAAKNSLEMTITECNFKLVYDSTLLRLDHIEPSYPLKGDEASLGSIEPRVKKTVAFYMDPQLCSESFLEGVLTYKDIRGNLQTVTLARKLAAVVCPIMFTDENINTAMLKRMCEGELDKKDAKFFRIPEGMFLARAFEIGKAAIKHHDVRLVREFSEPEPYKAEAWYYGKVKCREDRLVLRVRVLEYQKALEFFVASSSKLMLTGLLAELKNDLAKELKLENVAGEMVQLTDAASVRELSAAKAILDGAPEETENL